MRLISPQVKRPFIGLALNVALPLREEEVRRNTAFQPHEKKSLAKISQVLTFSVPHSSPCLCLSICSLKWLSKRLRMDDARPSTTKSTCGPDMSDKSLANRRRWPPESHLLQVWTGDQTGRQVASCTVPAR